VGPIKVEFLNHVFMLFDAILTAVSEIIAFNLTKGDFGKVTYGSFDVFIRGFSSVKLS
jgi:hypothetical protein